MNDIDNAGIKIHVLLSAAHTVSAISNDSVRCPNSAIDLAEILSANNQYIQDMLRVVIQYKVILNES